MIPNTSVNPAASRKSSTPNCRPLSACVRKRPRVIGEEAIAQANTTASARREDNGARSVAGNRRPGALLQRALRVVGVLVVLQRIGDGLEADATLRILGHFED